MTVNGIAGNVWSRLMRGLTVGSPEQRVQVNGKKILTGTVSPAGFLRDPS